MSSVRSLNVSSTHSTFPIPSHQLNQLAGYPQPRTRSFPATNVAPSEAIVTLRIATSSSGTYPLNSAPACAVRERTNELMSTCILSKVPDLHATRLITRDEFALVRVDDHVVDRSVVCVISLDLGRPVRINTSAD